MLVVDVASFPSLTVDDRNPLLSTHNWPSEERTRFTWVSGDWT